MVKTKESFFRTDTPDFNPALGGNRRDGCGLYIQTR
jgi:hypothetical protein